jgi:arylsulfatase A
MDKIKFVTIAWAIIAILPIKTWSQIKQAKIANKPNVILIYTDDQGTLDLNIYGANDLQTPNLDKLARKGTRFSRFYSASPICSPSRASLLTGRYPQRAGLVGNAAGMYGGGGMPGSQYTMAEMFKESGYKTAHIGKWHLGYSPETMPNAQGFDYSFGFMGGCIDNYYQFYYLGGPNQHDKLRNGKEIYEPGKFYADLLIAEASKFLIENKTDPFFMYFAINAPHYPLQPEKKWIDYYKDLPMPRRMYAAYISTMDDKIGQLLKQVDDLGLTNNTIIIFQSDQGHSKEDRSFGGGGYAGAYRGAKFSLFEGGILVPAFISWPGHIPANAVRNQFAANIDWFPTLAEYCQIPLPKVKIDGRSIVNLIKSDQAESPHQEFYWQCLGTKESPQWAVREGDWKLLHDPIEARSGDLDENKIMLINIRQDSSERINLAAKYPDVVMKLKKKYENWLKEATVQ